MTQGSNDLEILRQKAVSVRFFLQCKLLPYICLRDHSVEYSTHSVSGAAPASKLHDASASPAAAL